MDHIKDKEYQFFSFHTACSVRKYVFTKRVRSNFQSLKAFLFLCLIYNIMKQNPLFIGTFSKKKNFFLLRMSKGGS